MQKGTIVKFVGGVATVCSCNSVFTCAVRKNLHEEGLFVGDRVSLSYDNTADAHTVEKLERRTNLLKRPPIANVDKLVIILSHSPKPDLVLVDKLLLKCFWEKIEPIICINKIDKAGQAFVGAIRRQYNDVSTVCEVSALSGEGVEAFKMLLRGKFVVFAGQSAVGKSTLLNAIAPNINAETGGLSKRTERGKHTTRFNQIYLIDDNIMLADTPGFSMFSLDDDISSDVLAGLYPDFMALGACKYRNCSHINMEAKACAVQSALEEGKLDKDRYRRFCEIYKEIKKREDNKYG